MKITTKENLNSFLMENQSKLEDYLHRKMEPLLASMEVEDSYREQLLSSTSIIVKHLILEEEEQLIKYAEQQGEIWIAYILPLNFKMQFGTNLRRIMWMLVKEFSEKHSGEKIDFFEIEYNINYFLDKYITHFTNSYNENFNRILEEKQNKITELTAPIIPAAENIAIVPIIAEINLELSINISGKVMNYVRESNITTIILDLSGIKFADSNTIAYFLQIRDGLNLMGCNTVFTGIKSNIAINIVELGVNLSNDFDIFGTVQDALSEIIKDKELK